MLRRLAPIIAIFTLAIFLVFPVSKVKATSPSDITSIDQLNTAVSSDGSLNKDLSDFCKKRQGNQMNLETWYSGKCTPGGDTFSGDNVGFSDIVILDLAEKLSGSNDPTATFTDTLKDLLGKMNNSQASLTPEQGQIALNDARQKITSNQNSGLIGQSNKLIGLFYQNQPASTQSYLAYVTRNLQNHKIIPAALAASSTSGVGFATFAPFLTIWQAVRNLAYIGLVAFFIVYGFMMMFRVNLGQKTVITVQLAIPKLIVTLLIITFSYAIVGLVYDLMWVIIYFLFNYLASQNLIVYGNTWHPAMTAAGNGKLGLIGSLLLNSTVAGPAAIFGVLNLVLGGVGAAVGTLAGYFTGINFIVGLIILIAILISYGKLIFKLIGAFISVVISLITAPVVLLGNAFPGSQAIGNWFRSIIGNLSVFPATMLFLLFSYLLMVQPMVGICSKVFGDNMQAALTFFGLTAPGQLNVCENIFGVKNLVDVTTSVSGVPLISPAIVGFDASGLLALIGVGLLLMASKYVDMVRDALKVPPFKYGSDIVSALSAGAKVNKSWADTGYDHLPRQIQSKLASPTNKKITDAAPGVLEQAGKI
jgi:hypothetical protein